MSDQRRSPRRHGWADHGWFDSYPEGDGSSMTLSKDLVLTRSDKVEQDFGSFVGLDTGRTVDTASTGLTADHDNCRGP